MKKFFILFFSMLALSVSAQYRYASGAIVGSMFGGTYKMYCSDHIVLQTDLTVGLHKAPGAFYFDRTYIQNLVSHFWDFSLNPNLMYQAPIADVKVGWLNWFAGMGVSGGIASPYKEFDLYGKVGLNAIAGIEYVFEGMPLSLSADFRPGYTCILQKALGGIVNDHMFDWGVGLSVRYYVQ